jgi:hypothetical protein
MMGSPDLYMLLHSLFYLTPTLAFISNVRVLPPGCAMSLLYAWCSAVIQLQWTRCLNYIKKILTESAYLTENITWHQVLNGNKGAINSIKGIM